MEESLEAGGKEDSLDWEDVADEVSLEVGCEDDVVSLVVEVVSDVVVEVVSLVVAGCWLPLTKMMSHPVTMRDATARRDNLR